MWWQRQQYTKSKHSEQRTRFSRWGRVFFIVLLLGALPTIGHSHIGEVSLAQEDLEFVPFFADDLDRSSLKAAVLQSVAALRQRDESQILAFGDQRISISLLRESLETFAEMLDTEPDIGAALLQNFDIYRVTSPVLFTGYHEPVVNGSLVQTERYRYPLYRVP